MTESRDLGVRTNMGCFDSVIVNCPKCGEEIEFQTKSGMCQLKRYSIDHVPVEIARGLHGNVETCICGEKVCLVNPLEIPLKLPMKLYSVKSLDEETKEQLGIFEFNE